MIATNWKYNSEVISDRINGILVPIKDSNAVTEAILRLYNDREYQYQIAINNVREAVKYHPDRVLKDFYNFLD